MRSLIFTAGLVAVLASACSDFGDPVQSLPCTLDVEMLDFGVVPIGASQDRTLEIHNGSTGEIEIEISSNCVAEFEVVSGGIMVIPAGESRSAIVRFTPTAVGSLECEMNVGSACGVALCRGLGVNPPTVSFVADVQPIFDGHCIGCHRPFGEGELDLNAPVSYAQVVNHVSRNYAPALRIQPGYPEASVLFNKISDTDVFGDVMPPIGGGSPAVTAEEIDVIRAWILEGAFDN